MEEVILVSCGSFNPITYEHLRLFERAQDCLQSKYKIVKKIISPVHSSYEKLDLIDSKWRIEMCKLAVVDTNIEIDEWEANQELYTPTLHVLRYLETKYKKKIIFVMGSDLFRTFSYENTWNKTELSILLRDFECVVISRNNFDVQNAILQNEILFNNKNNINIEYSITESDISSTKIRLLIRRNKSIKYLTKDNVIEYIKNNNLYK